MLVSRLLGKNGHVSFSVSPLLLHVIYFFEHVALSVSVLPLLFEKGVARKPGHVTGRGPVAKGRQDQFPAG